MKNYKTLILIASFFISFSSNAQDAKVILYNSQPIMVQLEGDKISAFVGEAPREYMKGFDLAKRNEVTIIPTEVNTPTIKGELINANYAVLSSERILLNYKSGFATLDKITINELNKIASRLKADTQSRLLLTAQSNGSKVSEKLAENRLKSAIMYLKIKGISNDRVESSTLEGESLSDVITINFLQ